jgi:hypothetical protein
VSPETFVKAQLAAFAHREAYETGALTAMLAVACILRNRVRKGWHGGDWMTNLNHACEYAPFKRETTDPDEYDLTNGAFRRVLQEVDDIYSGVYGDEFSSNGLYYLDTGLLQSGRVIRPWFEQRILGDGASHPRIAQVGNLVIFA